MEILKQIANPISYILPIQFNAIRDECSTVDTSLLVFLWSPTGLPQNATDWLKCYCIFRLKCSKAKVDGMVWIGSVNTPKLRALCRKAETRLTFSQSTP